MRQIEPRYILASMSRRRIADLPGRVEINFQPTSPHAAMLKIQADRQKGISISNAEAAAIEKRTRAQELGTLALEAEADKLRIQSQTLNMSTGQAKASGRARCTTI